MRPPYLDLVAKSDLLKKMRVSWLRWHKELAVAQEEGVFFGDFAEDGVFQGAGGGAVKINGARGGVDSLQRCFLIRFGSGVLDVAEEEGVG